MKYGINNRILELNGYRVVYQPDHPRAMQNENWKGYVYEHIVVAEKFGSKLTDNEVVHHLDGDRSNNQYANLLVLTKPQHGRLHFWLNAGAPGIERFRENGENSPKAKCTPPKFCKVCRITLQDSQISFCSESCRGLDQRKVERPTKDQLMIDIQQLSMVKVGKKYGVSDNAVRRWLKSYGVHKPTVSRAESTLSEGSETSGEVQPS